MIILYVAINVEVDKLSW